MDILFVTNKSKKTTCGNICAHLFVADNGLSMSYIWPKSMIYCKQYSNLLNQ